MNQKLPADAFSYYWSLGPDRSYQAVAEKYEVSKRAVSKLANRENWQRRIVEIDKKVQESTDQKIAESLEQMNERHIKVCKLIQSKAIEALRTLPIGSSMDAVRALDMTIKQERLIRGEPTDRNAVSVEDTIRQEYQRWLVNSNDTELDEDDADDAEAE